ncbi:GTP pyrophosphokinase [Shewanella baltica]|uniref:GTP pyrophosphokinase n=1 Tax=Shewanella baltica TaxID=62322 RepID=UPI003D06BD98
MNIKLFRDELASQQLALDAWGACVSGQVEKIASQHGLITQILSYRVKDIDSAIGKITRKKYNNPLEQMTDLVGVRVVFTLSTDVERFKQAVMSYLSWSAILTRDPADEINSSPEKFQYQSVHIEIRPMQNFVYNGVSINSKVCCELQVRSLMQHTYAEVVHDNIYKSSWPSPTKAKRFVASSAALIDTADHMFCETLELLQKENKQRGILLEKITQIYDSFVQVTSPKDQKMNLAVIDAFHNKYSSEEELISDLQILLEQKKFIPTKINSRLNIDPFWSQPVSLLAYLLVRKYPVDVRGEWPFSASIDALDMVYSDLGISI